MIRVAILGAGIGAEHLAGYLQLPEHFDVRLVVDRDTDRAAALTGTDRIEIAADVETALDRDDIDLIDICLPPHLHVPVTLQAIQQGKDIICEKPIATSLSALDQIEHSTRSYGGRVFPVFQYRYGPNLKRLRRLQAEGLCGRLFAASLETHWNRGADYYAMEWRGTWAGEQGGAIIGHAIHSHDLLTHCLGPVASVFALLDTRVNAIETEDCASIVFGLQSGASVTSSITLGAANDQSRLRFLFENITVESDRMPYAPGEGEWQFTPRSGDVADAIAASLARPLPARSGFAGFLEDVARAIASGEDTAVTLADGRASIELATAIYLSSRTKSPVTLPLTRDCALYDGWQPS
ncbi:MAG: Gfo/Idh/MocA family oxidoreductase [Pseudomonadota bacterium]